MNGDIVGKKMKKAIRFTRFSRSLVVSIFCSFHFYLWRVYICQWDFRKISNCLTTRGRSFWNLENRTGNRSYDEARKLRFLLLFIQKVRGNGLWIKIPAYAGMTGTGNYWIASYLAMTGTQQKSPMKANPNAIGDNTDEVGTIDYGVLRVRSWPW
jgi:hypothetical protein